MTGRRAIGRTRTPTPFARDRGSPAASARRLVLSALAVVGCHGPAAAERSAADAEAVALDPETLATDAGKARVEGSVASARPPDAPTPADRGTGGPEPIARAPPWATWPMPNSPSSGLPNPQSYDLGLAGVVVDRITSLMWQRRIDPDAATFEQARERCDRLVLAGFDDWRLPSRIELLSIVDLGRTLPSLDPKAFPQTPNDWFWTASTADAPGAAWYVYFYFGYPKTDLTTNRFSYRCVRSAGPVSSRPRPHYEVSAATVRDEDTGLVWQRAPAVRPMKYNTARAYCARLDLGGQRGWRLPSMLELLTLVDEKASSPSIDLAAFPATPPESFWTSSTFAESPAMAWHVTFDHGSALYGLLGGAHRVRCVR